MKDTFPPAMAAVAGQLFRKGDLLHPEARLRFADWLSHHLSTFGLAWPWKKWGFVLAQPPAASQRRTVARTLRKLSLLAFWRARGAPSYTRDESPHLSCGLPVLGCVWC